MKNEKGFILAAVLAMTLLVMILGTAAIKMSELGYMAYGSGRKYQVAGTASEFGLNTAIASVVTNSACPVATSGTVNTGGVNASYSYFSVSGGGYCFIHGKGTFGGATVVKTAVVPASVPAQLAAVVFRNGGHFDVGGSSTIQNCNTTCRTPGVVYGGTVSNSINDINNDESCTGAASEKGIYGSPNAIQDKEGNACNSASSTCTGEALSDRIPELFNSTDWTSFKNDLAGNYNGFTIDVTNLSASGMPSVSGAPAVSSACTCSCSVTLGTGTTTCCSGGAAKTISSCAEVKVDGALTINGIPSSISTIVSTGNITASGVTSSTGNFTNKSIFATGTAGITMNDSEITLNNTSLVAGGGVSLTSFGTVSNSSKIVSEGTGGVSIAGSGTISNSAIVTTNASGSVSKTGASLANATIVSKNDFNLDSGSGTLTDVDVFSKTITVQSHPGSIAGGIFYSQGDTTFPATYSGTTTFGTVADPVLMLTGGDMIFNHTSGQTNFNGLVYAEGYISLRTTGNFDIRGAVVTNSNNTSSTLSSDDKNKIKMNGQPAITFRPDVLSTLATDIGSKMKPVNCSGGSGRKTFITSTKITIY